MHRLPFFSLYIQHVLHGSDTLYFMDNLALIFPEASAERAMIGHVIQGIHGIKKKNKSIAGEKQRYVLALSAEKHLPCDLQTATFSTTACSGYSNKVHSWRQRAEVVWLRKRCSDTTQGLKSACNQGWHEQTPVEARWCKRGSGENKNDRRAHFLWEPLHSSNEELPCGNTVARSSRGPENQNLYVKYLNF